MRSTALMRCQKAHALSTVPDGIPLNCPLTRSNIIGHRLLGGPPNTRVCTSYQTYDSSISWIFGAMFKDGKIGIENWSSISAFDN